MQLSQDAFQRAREFLMTKGRPLEQTMFRHFFESASVDDILDILAKHQDENGGFFEMGEGGLEGTTPIGSTIAFQYLREFGVTSESLIVKRGVRYFLETYDQELGMWPPRPGLSEDEIKNRIPQQWGNPSAEIIAYLWLYQDLVPRDFLEDVTKRAMANLRATTVPIFAFADMCFLKLADFLEPAFQEEICKKVTAGVWENLQLDHKQWKTRYFVKPYWYARTPRAPLYEILAEEINACLDFEIETQELEGCFKLTWEVTGRERNIWKSIWTMEILRVLDAFDRLE